MDDLKKELASLRLDHEPPRSRRGAWVVIAVLVFMVAAGTIFWWGGGVRLLRPVAPYSRLPKFLRSQSHRIPPSTQRACFDEPSYRRVGQFFPIRKLQADRQSAANENYEIRLCSYCIWTRNKPCRTGVAHASAQPAAATAYTMTPGRIAASTAAAVGLISLVIGGLALARSRSTD